MIESDLSSRLSAYMDGELSDAEAKQVEDLLRNDPRARAAFEDLRRTSSAMRGFFDAESQGRTVSPAREAEVVERISRASARIVAVRSRRGRRAFLWFAALMSFAILLLWGLRRLERSRSATDSLRSILELMESEHYELSPDPDSDPAGATSLWQVGPRGRFHVRHPNPAGFLHEGFDGRRTWRYVDGDGKVLLLSGESARVVREANPWKRLEAALWAAVDDEGDGEAWEIQSESRNGGRVFRLRGPEGENVRVDLDSEDRLVAVTLDGKPYVVVRRPALGDEAFTWETWAPGIPVEEAGR